MNVLPAAVDTADVYTPALSTIRVIDTDGDVHTFNDAFILGVWSKSMLIQSYVQKSFSANGLLIGGEVMTTSIDLADLDRVEVDTFDDDHSGTSEELCNIGLLDENWNLDMTGGAAATDRPDLAYIGQKLLDAGMSMDDVQKYIAANA
jgi:hypothetical protein